VSQIDDILAVKKKYEHLELDLTQDTYEGVVYRVRVDCVVRDMSEDNGREAGEAMIELLSVVAGKEAAESGTLHCFSENANFIRMRLVAAP
jgi:hypothetical protein